MVIDKTRSEIASSSFLSMPLFVKDDIVAVLNLSDKETKETFDDNDRDVLSIMINEITFALENTQLHITFSNPKTAELTGYSAEELSRLPFFLGQPFHGWNRY